jgi:hypothetical protein
VLPPPFFNDGFYSDVVWVCDPPVCLECESDAAYLERGSARPDPTDLERGSARPDAADPERGFARRDTADPERGSSRPDDADPVRPDADRPGR